MRPTFALLGALLVLLPGVARGQAEHDPRPRVVDTSEGYVPSPEVAAQIEALEERRHAAEGRASAFGALTIGGTTLLIGGVVAMVVVAAIEPEGCTGMPDCITPVEDFAAGITLAAIGGAAVLIGGILWGDADKAAADLGRRIEELRHPVPTFSLGEDGFRLGLRGAF